MNLKIKYKLIKNKLMNKIKKYKICKNLMKIKKMKQNKINYQFNNQKIKQKL